MRVEFFPVLEIACIQGGIALILISQTEYAPSDEVIAFAALGLICLMVLNFAHHFQEKRKNDLTGWEELEQ